MASRRASEKLILDGRVSVNGRPEKELGVKVDAQHDAVAVDGQPVKPKRKLYIALNKPRGYLCSRQTEANYKLIGDLLPKEWSNLYSVGRLDRESEGLIFLTNDGDFSLRLTHPRYGVVKTYLAIIGGRVEEAMLKKFTQGITDRGERLRAKSAKLLRASNRQSLVELELSEGKNREVRRLFESQGLEVLELKRTRIGRIRLGELPPGKWRTLTEAEIKSLLSAL